LCARNRFWWQYIFEFSHELLHIITNYDQAHKHDQEWCVEVICDVASLYGVEAVGKELMKDKDNKLAYDFGSTYEKYLNDCRIDLPKGKSLIEYLGEVQPALQQSYNIPERNPIASQLAPFFMKSPEIWECVQFLNKGRTDEHGSLKNYMEGWQNSVNESLKQYVVKFAKEFGIDIH
jgi:hypothetical protein